MENTKKCRLCKSQIDKDAKKCPVCRSIQNKLFSPVVPSFLFTILLVLVIGIIIWAIYDEVGSDIFGTADSYNDELVITESELKFGKNKCDKDAVIIIGKIKNNSSVDWRNIKFEIKCFDSNNKMTDTDQESAWGFVMPAEQETPFKVSFDKQLPEEQYIRYEIRIINADERDD